MVLVNDRVNFFKNIRLPEPKPNRFMDGYAAYNEKLHAGYASKKVDKKMTYEGTKKLSSPAKYAYTE